MEITKITQSRKSLIRYLYKTMSANGTRFEKVRGSLVALEERTIKGKPRITVYIEANGVPRSFNNSRKIFDANELDVASLKKGDLIDIIYWTWRSDNGEHTSEIFLAIKPVNEEGLI